MTLFFCISSCTLFAQHNNLHRHWVLQAYLLWLLNLQRHLVKLMTIFRCQHQIPFLYILPLRRLRKKLGVHHLPFLYDQRVYDKWTKMKKSLKGFS